MFLTAPQPQAPAAAPPSPSMSMRQPAMTAAQQMPSSPHATMTELLVVGHLPVRAGLWLVPYADLLARQMGTVCLVRLDSQEPTLQLLRAPESMATAPLRMSLQQTIAHLANCVDVWMLRGSEGLSANDAIDCGTDRITILSSADEAAVVAAYQTIKELAQAAEHPNRSLPAIGMAMVGCDADAAAAVIDRLCRTSLSFLGVEVKLVALLPRMDAGIKCTRYVTFGAEASPSALTVSQWLQQAKAQERTAAPAAMAPPILETAMPEQPAVIGRIAPPPETFVHDARRILRAPSHEYAEPPAASSSLPPPPAPPPIQSPASRPAPLVTEAERQDLLSAIAPGVSGAKLPPKVVIDLEHKPAPPQRPIIEPDDHGQPIPLAKFVAGLNALPLRPPGHERVEIAVDEHGRLHLLARESNLRELPVVERWAHAHREILAMACPQHRFDPAGATICHVFSAEPATLADLHGSNLRLHVLAPVTLDDRTAWYAAPLNIVG